MTLSDFLDAVASGTDLKVLGKMLKELPTEDRRAAGIAFQKAKAASKPTLGAQPQKKRQPKGAFLWSLNRGPFGDGMTMHEGELLIGNGRSLAVLITGENLKVKEIKTPR